MTRKEAATAIAKHVDANKCIAASDSGHGLVQAFKEAKMPLATARHYIDEMTLLQKPPQSSFSKQQLALARKLTTAKRPAAACEKEHVVIVGGDNATSKYKLASNKYIYRVKLLD